ncbi:aromatic alcohol reductase [Allopusillimonas soli]|uniref:Aromatic alcohol reductase n=1 Tax=Allopusillimonas soli TaxID=659016 RepID=A0A853FJQ3_9BURK|nr:aromatic alcohol reductase [Allopusillimonas soli]NYT38166.1 aromatic alcohol reductase [Allopusillimonas soli]TEA74038.1 aromatic alcohol reductase [Allopusillimonas soli]
MNQHKSGVDTEHMLVLGAGQLGMAVLRELAPRRQNAKTRLTVLISPKMWKSPSVLEAKSVAELIDLGAELLPFDLFTCTEDELTEVFKRFRTVINCTGFVAGPGTQMKVTRAALSAEVCRYFPWQFGVDYDIVGKGSGQPVFDEQYDVRTLLRSQNRTEWVIVSTGMFTSFLFEPAFGIVDFNSKTVHGLGTWETKVTVTTPEDIGRLTAEIVLEQPRIANEIIYVASDTLSYATLADILEDVTNTPFTRKLLTREYLNDMLGRHPDDVMARYRTAFALGDGMWWEKAVTYNESRSIPTTDVASWLHGHLDAVDCAH